MSESQTSNQWVVAERIGRVEVRPYDHGDQERILSLSISEADMRLPTLVGGFVARNPENHRDQWYIARAYFEKYYRPAVETAANPRAQELFAALLDFLNQWKNRGEETSLHEWHQSMKASAASAEAVLNGITEETSASIPAKYGHFWYVEELTAGRWHRSAQGHSWALEADARDQCEELRRRYSDRVYRVTESEDAST